MKKEYEEPLNTLNNYCPKGLILDVGCGNFSITNLPAATVVGIDIKPVRKPNFVLASVEMLPFRTECFDFVYSLSVLEYLKSVNDGLSEMVRVLKKNHRLMFTMTTKYSFFSLWRRIFQKKKVLNLSRSELSQTLKVMKTIERFGYNNNNNVYSKFPVGLEVTKHFSDFSYHHIFVMEK